ncbi:MAG: ATP-binding cassette domain-containing protein [Chloroflexota bacterium]
MMNISDVAKKYPPLIEYRNLTLMRGNRKALDGISLSIAVGENVAILGPNGAGKSSLIKTITRELHTFEENPGSYLRILGKERWNVMELRNQLGIVSPEGFKSSFYEFSCLEIVLSGFFSSAGIWAYQEVTAEMRKKAKEVMKFLGIYHLAGTSIDEVSTGESRLVTIARSLVNDPLAMLLDEPTSSLDPQATRKLRLRLSKIAKQGTGIVMITHNLSDIIPEIQRVILIRGGKVVQDGDKDEILTAKTLSALFGGKLELIRRDGYYYCW